MLSTASNPHSKCWSSEVMCYYLTQQEIRTSHCRTDWIPWITSSLTLSRIQVFVPLVLLVSLIPYQWEFIHIPTPSHNRDGKGGQLGPRKMEAHILTLTHVSQSSKEEAMENCGWILCLPPKAGKKSHLNDLFVRHISKNRGMQSLSGSR